MVGTAWPAWPSLRTAHHDHREFHGTHAGWRRIRKQVYVPCILPGKGLGLSCWDTAMHREA
eukprot:1560755-Prymnesium_polylepis.1